MDLTKMTKERLQQLIAINEAKMNQSVYNGAKAELIQARALFEKALELKLK